MPVSSTAIGTADGQEPRGSLPSRLLDQPLDVAFVAYAGPSGRGRPVSLQRLERLCLLVGEVDRQHLAEQLALVPALTLG